MGPASLPTPLSPTRGHPASNGQPASRSSIACKDTLGVRCLTPFAVRPPFRARGPVLSACPKANFRVWLRHRRSRRHPALLPCTLHAYPWPKPVISIPPAITQSRDCTPIRSSISNGRLWFAPHAPSIADQAHSLSRWYDFALVSSDPTCLGPRPSA